MTERHKTKALREKEIVKKIQQATDLMSNGSLPPVYRLMAARDRATSLAELAALRGATECGGSKGEIILSSPGVKNG